MLGKGGWSPWAAAAAAAALSRDWEGELRLVLRTTRVMGGALRWVTSGWGGSHPPPPRLLLVLSSLRLRLYMQGQGTHRGRGPTTRADHCYKCHDDSGNDVTVSALVVTL